MSRFPNKLVMGGSDRESTESEDEYYMPGQGNGQPLCTNNYICTMPPCTM